MNDPRMETNEFFRLIADHPTVAFNYRNFKGGVNSPGEGYRTLVVLEPQMADGAAWDINVIGSYDNYITWNEKWADRIRNYIPGTNVIVVKGSVFCNHYTQLEHFPSYEDRYNAVVVQNKLYCMGGEGEITQLREDFVNQLNQFTETYNMVAHVYSPTSWGGDAYQGEVESPIHHSHINQLTVQSKYRFALCLESTYHELWSYGFMTERLFNAFKTKTVPIYYGCYNIQDYVPQELFIDWRDYSDIASILDYISKMPKTHWEDITEAGYEWEKSCDYGSVEILEGILRGLE